MTRNSLCFANTYRSKVTVGPVSWTTQRRLITLLTLAICPIACQSAPRDATLVQKPVVAGLNTKWFTATSNNEIRVPPGVTTTPIVGKDGKPNGATVVARDNDTGTITCSCPSACQGSCHMEKDEQTGWTRFWCVGTCSNSEGLGCGMGGCGPVVSGARSAVGEVAVQPAGNQDVPPPKAPGVDVLGQDTRGQVVFATTQCTVPNEDGQRCDVKTCKKDQHSDCGVFADRCIQSGHQYSGSNDAGTCTRQASPVG